MSELINIKEFINYPKCIECEKEIWGISHIRFTIGMEHPALLHSVCYEQLKENAGGDK